MFTESLRDERDLRIFLGYQFLGFLLALVLVVLSRSLALPGVAAGGLLLAGLHGLLFFDFRLVLSVHAWGAGGLFLTLGGAALVALASAHDGAALAGTMALPLAALMPLLNRRLVEASAA